MIDSQTSNEELRRRLRSAQTNPDLADEFFNSFHSKLLLENGRYLESLDLGLHLMNRCLGVDSAAYAAIHKGTGFYWLGTVAYLVHDLETAIYFFDAAIVEDLRYHASPDHPSPAFRFILLEGENQNQAARQLVQDAEAKVNRLIDHYNRIALESPGNSSLTLAEIRERFLRRAISQEHKSWHTLATAFISFLAGWDYRNILLDLRPEHGTLEPFLSHLSKGCVLFESLLRQNPKSTTTAGNLNELLRELYSMLGLSKNPDISGTLGKVIKRIPSEANTIESAIRITGMLRNSISHSIADSSDLPKIPYQRMYEKVGIACLHAIRSLY